MNEYQFATDMPQMNGHELAARFATLRPEMSVLYISGYDEEMVADQGLMDPARQFFQKPFLPRDVARKVREILDKTVSTHLYSVKALDTMRDESAD